MFHHCPFQRTFEGQNSSGSRTSISMSVVDRTHRPQPSIRLPSRRPIRSRSSIATRLNLGVDVGVRSCGARFFWCNWCTGKPSTGVFVSDASTASAGPATSAARGLPTCSNDGQAQVQNKSDHGDPSQVSPTRPPSRNRAPALETPNAADNPPPLGRCMRITRIITVETTMKRPVRM